MTGQTDWLSAIGILLAGLVLGFMFIYAFVMRRREAPAGAEDLELRDLEAKRDALLQQLRELEAGDADERARLEVEAAQVLRKIDARTNVATGFSPAPSRDGLKPVATSGTGFFARHPELKGFVWGVASIGALAFLWYFGFQSAKPKDEGTVAPMQQAQTQQQPQPAVDDAAVKALEARVQQSPDDLALRHELTHLYLDKQNMMGVFEQTEYILKKTPNDAQAQTYQALVRMAADAGYDFALLRSAIETNDVQRRRMIDKITRAAGGDLAGAQIGAWGIAFKAGTDDVRDSPAVGILRELLAAGATVRAHDPLAVTALDGLEQVASPLEACDGVDVLVVLTEWPEFREVELGKVAAAMAGSAVVDTRNLLDRDAAIAAGLRIVGVGR